VNEELYQAAMSGLTARGVPVSAAEKASYVVSKDDPAKPDLGRTEEDQRNVRDAMTWMNAERLNQ